jgi:FMN phosphatase YigB (HAD superfamily)
VGLRGPTRNSRSSTARCCHSKSDIKPHPPIYQHAVDTHDLDPQSTLYIDDLPQNIATGREFGFHCHQYDLRNHAAFERWLAFLHPI